VIKNCYRESGDSRYVIKQLQKQVIDDPKKLLQGLADLNLETKFLSSLPHHPNVIKLRAIADGDRFHPDYFLILDRLFDTLEQRIVQWKTKAKNLDAAENFLRSLMKLQKSNPGKASLMEERARLLHDQVWTAYDLSSAIAHLHKHAIMHRDIKPSNIGFDIVSRMVPSTCSFPLKRSSHVHTSLP
jgi:serine/threonine protein kinase